MSRKYNNCPLVSAGNSSADEQTHHFGRKCHNGSCVGTKPRSLMLNFTNNILKTVYTGISFEKQEIRLEIKLTDNNVVINDGPESSALVEIVVLSKDFNFNQENNWSSEEFNSRIVDRNESLLGGQLFLPLKQGVADVSQICFRHRSQHTRKNEYRLGARIVNSFNGDRVREAKTEPFTVKDRRIKSKKHYPPSLDDEVWRLEKIGKEGPFHKRLGEKNIKTVEDFLIELNKNPENLRNILHMNKSSKKWKAVEKHAKTCELGDANSMDQPSDTQKARVHDPMTSAFDHRDEAVNVHNCDVQVPSWSNTPLSSDPWANFDDYAYMHLW